MLSIFPNFLTTNIVHYLWWCWVRANQFVKCLHFSISSVHVIVGHFLVDLIHIFFKFDDIFIEFYRILHMLQFWTIVNHRVVLVNPTTYILVEKKTIIPFISIYLYYPNSIWIIPFDGLFFFVISYSRRFIRYFYKEKEEKKIKKIWAVVHRIQSNSIRKYIAIAIKIHNCKPSMQCKWMRKKDK